MSPVMWPRMRDDYEPGSANPGQSLVKSSSQDAWEPGAEPGGGGGGGGEAIQVGGTQPASGWWLDNGAAAPDTTPPSTVTGLTATATGSSTVDLSWNAATDDIGVAGYEYRIDAGAPVDAGAGTTETVSGLAAETEYGFQVRAYDAQGNRSATWSEAATATTLAGPDLAPPTPGTLAASAVADTSFTLTVTGATDDTGLHAQPYAFSTDNGATWSAWQASATFAASGLSASTGYQARHKVRDAAGNEATGTAITVTTSAPEPLLEDDFERELTDGSLGTSTSGHPWTSTGDWSTMGSVGSKYAYASSSATIAHADVLASNLSVTANVQFVAVNLAGPMLRVSADGLTFYRLTFVNISETKYMIHRVVGGTTSTLLNNIGVGSSTSGVIKFTAAEDGAGGTVLTATVDGVEIGSFTDTASTRPTGTRIGITGGVRWHDLTAYPA